MKKRSGSEHPSGALLIDKESGVTSYDVIRILKRRFAFDRIGHAGTLDPLATGLLVVLLGEATRVQSVVMDGRKSYEGEIRLGAQTSTDDITGQVIERDELLAYRNVPREELVAKIKHHFRGTLQQRPPLVSALKKDGERSYDLVRRGELPELGAREIEIFSFSASFIDDRTVAYRVECSRGTYVRSIARDLGHLLGSYGCISSLRRTASGRFKVDSALLQRDIERRSSGELEVLPLRDLVGDLPAVRLPGADIARLRRGDQRPLGPHAGTREGVLALFSDTGDYCGLLESCRGGGLRVRYLSQPPDGTITAE